MMRASAWSPRPAPSSSPATRTAASTISWSTRSAPRSPTAPRSTHPTSPTSARCATSCTSTRRSAPSCASRSTCSSSSGGCIRRPPSAVRRASSPATGSARASRSRAAGTRRRSAGSISTATASSPSRSARASSPATARSCGPVPASSPARTPSASWPRPRSSSARCSARSAWPRPTRTHRTPPARTNDDRRDPDPVGRARRDHARRGPPVTAAVQTLWAELVATTLADAGVVRCVISPGSRSTPLVAALAREPRLELTTLVDERSAGFFALGAARATGVPVALVCTSGTAAAHYLPAIVEASLASVPLLAFTADRPPELQACGASQTIDQVKLYGDFVRGAIDLGPPSPGELALRAVRRKIVQAITLASGPDPGPVQVQLPLRKPLEPAAPASDAERALAAYAARITGPVRVAAPRLAADPAAIAELAAAIAAEPDGVIVAGAMPASFAAARAAVLAFAARCGYPVIAEAGSQLRFGPRPVGAIDGAIDGAVLVDHFDLIPPAALPLPRLVIQLGAEPVAAAWPAWLARFTDAGAARWVL